MIIKHRRQKKKITLKQYFKLLRPILSGISLLSPCPELAGVIKAVDLLENRVEKKEVQE